ncbi:MAG: hypothetical protein OEU54_15450, partial [Gemmatimonadota bacterium]|nr:hypothetical protein [Gemmatimonadota bacterium]
VYESRKSAILVYPDPSDHPKELFIFEIRNGDYRFPSGRRVLFDRSLHRNFAGGLLAYHVNSDNSPSAPLVDMEGESPKSAPGQEPGKIRAIPGRLALTDTNLYDHSGTGMRVHVGPVGANGARDIRLWWARVGDSGNQGARFSGDQTELASARLDQDHLVTVAVDGASHGVRVWRPEDDGSVRRADFRNKRVSPAPANRGVAIAAGEFGGGRRFFITVQNQSNRVLHHAWSIRRGRQPAIDPLGKFRSSLPGGRSPKVVHITRSLFVSAGLNANGDVTLQSWRWSPDLVQDQSQPPTLSELVVASFDEFDLSTLAWVRRRGRRRVLLFVGRRRTNGKLRIFTFRVNTSTGRLTRGARLDAGEASDVHVRSLSTSRAVVSCCLPNNRVRLIILDVEDDGATVTRVADTKGHEHLKTTRHHSLTTSSSRVIVGSRNRQDDRLRVALWRVLNDGAVEWVTDSGNLAAEVGAVDISAQFGRRHRAITHVTTAGGRQKLIAWDVNNLPPDVF